MTAYAVIACDAEVPGLGRCMTEDSPLGEIQSVTKARARLRTAGWHRTRTGRDICPDCWKEGRR